MSLSKSFLLSSRIDKCFPRNIIELCFWIVPIFDLDCSVIESRLKSRRFFSCPTYASCEAASPSLNVSLWFLTGGAWLAFEPRTQLELKEERITYTFRLKNRIQKRLTCIYRNTNSTIVLVKISAHPASSLLISLPLQPVSFFSWAFHGYPCIWDV